MWCHIMRFGNKIQSRPNVVNGSVKPSNGKSLNDCLLVGPKHQPDLLEKFLKFKFSKIGFSENVSTSRTTLKR